MSSPTHRLGNSPQRVRLEGGTSRGKATGSVLVVGTMTEQVSMKQWLMIEQVSPLLLLGRQVLDQGSVEVEVATANQKRTEKQFEDAEA